MSKATTRGAKVFSVRQEKRSDPLVGKFFHSFEGGALHWQGEVIDRVSQDAYLIQLYEWFMGEPSMQKIVRTSEMVGWNFYDAAEDWNCSADRIMRAQKQGR